MHIRGNNTCFPSALHSFHFFSNLKKKEEKKKVRGRGPVETYMKTDAVMVLRSWQFSAGRLRNTSWDYY